MPKLTPRPTRRVVKALERAGWVRRTDKPGAKHTVLVHLTLPGILVVPRHPYVRKGTLGKIIKQAGLTLAEFERLYR